MSLLAVGSVALDSVETPFGRREEVLGGSATYFSTCASFFGPVRLVAVVGEDFPEEHVRYLAGRGIDLEGLARTPGRTFRWRGRYGFEGIVGTSPAMARVLEKIAAAARKLAAY